MRLWVDDIRPEPQGYTRASYSENEARNINIKAENDKTEIELIDLDHDAGDYCKDGGDYIQLLDWWDENRKRMHAGCHGMAAHG